ncbi:short-chain dehydrogenase/reductase SDR [Ruminiclostridium papyrosolvens DSM 2782]|uniref:Short-chain dehydrogenase/reductase SDR n=1 Tax=Ruminiclostridium papyrosolvens DSM 2782 TaxID=588581 RepID=F1TDR1_9FIRM|nr:SDR family oxidoreductase [Ruminiclostridium papyrosolvens]EGD47357.1 short-chain dehydrogenase/reductase SDR [Ruminiclostridium papyrosolvens DSM 2782]WES34703.1 SDR family oxidoreductase [Ruminiclostridium papyrosolvens DSM 2782]
MEISFSDKVVIITGGSRGIGKDLVRAFAQANAKVYFTYLTNGEKAQNVVDEFSRRYAATIKANAVDGRSKEDVHNFIETVITENKKIDVLINSAGYIPRGLFLNTSEDVWKNAIESNVSSIYNYCTNVLKYMLLEKGGCIINISSVSAHFPAKGQAAYSASKGAIESLTKALALEYGKYNIRVNTIAPGLVETEVVKTISNQVKQEILKRTPLGRFGRAEDVSNTALFLASENASYITGTQLLVTGGRHLD